MIDYRIFDPSSDGKSKLDHMQEMLQSIRERQIPFRTVLMDSWYATKEIMMLVENWNKTPSSPQNLDKKFFYCPLKSNRKVDDSGGSQPYRPVSELEWKQNELEEGKIIKIHGFAKEVKVKLFRVEVSSHRTDYIVTNQIGNNDLTQDSSHETRKVCAVRWKIEQYHRELKQLNSNNSRESNRVNVAKPVSSATIFIVRFWFGPDLKPAPDKHKPLPTNSSTISSKNSSSNNSKGQLSL